MPPPRRSQQGARDAEAKVLSALISSNRPLSKAEVSEKSGITGEQLGGALKRLTVAGQLRVSGATRSRRWCKVKEHTPHTAAGRNIKAATERNAKRLDDNVKRVGLRERVLKAIAADPAALNEDRLAQALNAHPDDVKEACAKLIELEKIELYRGAYIRVGQAQVG
jgi:hypothetical protein